MSDDSQTSGPPPVAGAARQTRDDPRYRRTRQAILSAGARLFGEHNPEGVSVDELTREAGVSKQSFYNHFVDKDALAFELLRQARFEIDAMVDALNRDETDMARRVATGLCMYGAQAVRNPTQARLLSHLLLDETRLAGDVNALVEIDLRAGLASGRLVIFSVRTGLAFLNAVAGALINRVLDAPSGDAPAQAAREFCILTLRAFGLPNAEAEAIALEAAHRAQA